MSRFLQMLIRLMRPERLAGLDWRTAFRKLFALRLWTPTTMAICLLMGMKLIWNKAVLMRIQRSQGLQLSANHLKMHLRKFSRWQKSTLNERYDHLPFTTKKLFSYLIKRTQLLICHFSDYTLSSTVYYDYSFPFIVRLTISTPWIDFMTSFFFFFFQIFFDDSIRNIQTGEKLGLTTVLVSFWYLTLCIEIFLSFRFEWLLVLGYYSHQCHLMVIGGFFSSDCRCWLCTREHP